MLVRRATAAECVEAHRRTFHYWGEGYENTVDAWQARKLAINPRDNIDVWVLVNADANGEIEPDPPTAFLAQAEVLTGNEAWVQQDDQTGRVNAVSVGTLFVKEEDRGKGYGKAMITLLMEKLAELGASVVTLMAGGAEPAFYESLGFALRKYTLYAMGPDQIQGSITAADQQIVNGIAYIDDEHLEEVAKRDAELLKEEVMKAPAGSLAIIPTERMHKRISNVYLTFGKDPAVTNKEPYHGVRVKDGADHLMWANYYRVKRLCITRLRASSPAVALALLEVARRRAASRKAEWIYLWLGEDDPLGHIITARDVGFQEREWFDAPMVKRSDGVDVGRWIANERYIVTTM
ncbi:hypothetical protein HK101_004496 [Irineochytrium annulatum]|nr:hypothetical protein HK101_004496 [Irineochytrium annulatum]